MSYIENSGSKRVGQEAGWRPGTRRRIERARDIAYYEGTDQVRRGDKEIRSVANGAARFAAIVVSGGTFKKGAVN